MLDSEVGIFLGQIPRQRWGCIERERKKSEIGGFVEWVKREIG